MPDVPFRIGAAPRLARYRIERLLGHGANAKVYLATDLELERPVALKIIEMSATKGRLEEIRARFEREAKLTARLQHPNIVVIHEFGEADDSLFLAMEYVAGGTLAHRLAEGDMPIAERLVLSVEIADAVAHAHDRGVLHRDLKPANILLAETGHAKVSDFGIGRLLWGDVDLTATGEMVGSPAYMSPEQARGERVDNKSDIFGLGVVLFHLLTGKRPFDGRNLPAIVSQIQNDPAPDPCQIEPLLPPEVTGILQRCLAKSKIERYGDAQELADDLRALLPAAAEAAPESPSQLRRRLSDSTGVGRRRTVAPPPALDGEEIETLRSPSPQAALAVAPAPPTRSLSPERRRLFLGIATAVAAVGALFAWFGSPRLGGRPAGTPSAPVATRRRALPTATVLPVATAVSTPVPAESAASFFAGLHSSWSRPAATTAHAVARSGLTLHVVPGTAYVFLDGRYAGVADDWSGNEPGSILSFDRAWRHSVRVAYPGHGDLEIDLVVTPNAREKTVAVSETLAPGVSSAPDGAVSPVPPPELRTTGAVSFAVSPAETRVELDGAGIGTAADFARKDLILDGPAVHTIRLVPEGRPPVVVRVRVAPRVGSTRAILRRKL